MFVMTDNKLIHKNDEITKSFLTNINVAKEFLTKYLHPTILARFPENTRFANENAGKRFLDFVSAIP